MNMPPLRHWLLGLALSLAVAWAAGALFLDTVQPLALDPSVGRYVAMPGTVSRTRSEGWAISRVGERGIRGLPGGKLPEGPKVVFQGDSFVEGLQVDDAERMAQVFTRMANQAGLALSGVGIGHGGDSLIDSFFRLADYTPVLGPVALQVMILGRIEEVLPDTSRPCRSRFVSSPEFQLERVDCPPSSLGLRLAEPLRILELSAGFEIFLKIQRVTLRLTPKLPPTSPGPYVPAPEASQDAACDYLLARIREQARGPVLLLHVPKVPRLASGRVRLDDPQAALAQVVGRACARNKVPFVDLGPAFIANFQATGNFPRGFFNSPPGTGHLNEEGHRLVAEAVLKYVKEHRDALLAP